MAIIFLRIGELWSMVSLSQECSFVAAEGVCAITFLVHRVYEIVSEETWVAVYLVH